MINQICSLTLLRSLFSDLDEYHGKQLKELKGYYEKATSEHDNYRKAAQASMDAMGEKYDYHNYDLGVDQELAFEAFAAESHLNFYYETLSQQQLSLLEMKVLYLYKEVEIRLKTIIANQYNKSTKQLSNLKLICEYFKSKGVILERIEGYRNVDSLRLVANDLKHSIKINKSRKIPEFTDLTEFTEESLEKFMHIKLYQVEMFLSYVVRESSGQSATNSSDESDFGIPF
ncbi:hypothetical protein [Photobacterium sanguinicancri]|uniref:hypothetical protein n=1 Tax=Photobacterium sanguinicancri TaxID=875932 RepID=UPI003D0E4722